MKVRGPLFEGCNNIEIILLGMRRLEAFGLAFSIVNSERLTAKYAVQPH